MDFFWFTILVLCVWRLTHLLQAEDGPWNVIVRIRSVMGNGFWGKLMDCFYCLSLWIAAPFACVFASDWKECLLFWPALSAGAILIERLTARPRDALYIEDEPEKEEENVLLR
jgi:hypothetical protein